MDLNEKTSMNSDEETSTDSEKTSTVAKKEIVVICPRVEAEVEFREGRFHFIHKIHGDPKEIKCEADTNTFYALFEVLEGTTKYVYCSKCYGSGHEECYKTSPIKHPLHPKHTLLFVKCAYAHRRKCLCCEDPLEDMFYCCPSCDFAINLTCVDKQPLLTIDYPKRHEHPLALFPRQVTTNCNVCALDDSRIGSRYICPTCDFVVHKKCIDLPWSIQISRHPQHRIFFTSSFAQGDLICNICLRKMNNDYGGYICNKEGCSYFAHSRCATGKNVWDGQELEGEPEEVEEEVEPFERLSDGTIRHFSHEHHPLRLIEDTTRVYDEYKSCKACVMPIYDGNFYSCLDLTCSFILHEACANISPRIYHAIHPHPLVSETGYPDDLFFCSACYEVGSGFFYDCKKCHFRLHFRCATIYEPLIHNSHMHPLFLTSAPQERRGCSICKDTESPFRSSETFNCIVCEYFSLCFSCAFIPQKLRYKHDDHILTFFYGEETSEIQRWCEVCETKIKTGERFYMCEACCVTLHIECLLKDLNFSLGSRLFRDRLFDILPNNRMTRPICSNCQKRCKHKMVFKCDGFEYCCFRCMLNRLNGY